MDGVCRETADPYARACGCNGTRSMVINLRRTDPPGWEEDAPPAKRPETVIYEIHVKDFSWDPASGVPADCRGRFKALTLEHTTLNSDGEHPTCLAYLRELGITHVQLMPVYDAGSVDEGGDDRQFNWSYDPLNYNVPEGSYSTDPRHGEVRIRELKEAVQSLHKNGFRVIMDVVYNHTFHLDSWLWRTAPWYHYRQRADGTPSDGSACGNDLASERSMCARYILDSVLYWAEEYHMDGFRFDLMGLLDVKLMNRIQKELDRRWGRGEKLIFGEPWSARGTAVRPGTLLADKNGLPALDPAIGAFCDATRDAVKGPIMADKEKIPGFVNGGGLEVETLANCLRGWTGKPFQIPAQTITYLSSHDDWTLWDKLVLTMDPNRRFDRLDPELLRANRLAAAICFTCQGRLFLLSGEEFGRTKQGVRDSVRSPLEINRLDWRRAWENRALVDYYRGLIALRMELPGLCGKSADAPRWVGGPEEPVPNCVTVQVDNGDGRWRRLFLAYSARRDEVPLELPQGEWELLADGQSSFLWQSPQAWRGQYSLAPVSAAFSATRGDHGILAAAVTAPTVRVNLVRRLSEELTVGERRTFLSTQTFAGGTPPEEGWKNLSSFVWDGTPTWLYHVDGVQVRRQCAMEYGANTAAVIYEIENRAGQPCTLRVTPFCLFGEGERAAPSWSCCALRGGGYTLPVRTNGRVVPTPVRRETLAYPHDARDGRTAEGSVSACCVVERTIQPGERGTLEIVFSLDDTRKSGAELLEAQKRRGRALAAQTGFRDPAARQLARSADAFVVRRESTDGMTIVAGYPFFGDWGRDTMIALPGCLLSTGRFEEAKSVLRTFLAYERDGLVPNLFPEGDGEPRYNTADAALLLVNCIWLYWERTGDEEFVREALPVLERIIAAYQRGTRHAIKMDTDGLISAGEGLDQVTWMDICVDGHLPTPPTRQAGGDQRLLVQRPADYGGPFPTGRRGRCGPSPWGPTTWPI